METGNFQADFNTMFTSLKGPTDNALVQSSELARYHSAPCSTFAALLQQNYLPSDSAELVQFLAHGGLGELASYGEAGLSLKANHKHTSCVKKEHITQHGYPNQNDMVVRHSGRASSALNEHISQGPLSAILEHAGEETLVSEPCQQGPTGSTSHKSMLAPSVQSNLIRHSSLPTDFLSRLAMEDMSERPAALQQIDSHVQTTSMRDTNSAGGKVYLVTSNLSPRAVPVRKCFADGISSCKADEYDVFDDDLKHDGLLRQSSSPAGLLSQLMLDEFSTGTDKLGMSSPQGLVHGHAMGGWNEAAMDSAMQKIAALGQRKRGRDTDARLYKGLTAANLLQMGSMDQGSCLPSNHYSVVGASNGDSISTDSVLCKSRAKRGCATHPRSIAERVRRMKISERMKKLQDLVPNLDKQQHTADMLDEVVEYVKLLQRQVQELSKHSDECNGMCQTKESDSLGM
eukprot:c545_g1_i1 orf=210-1583(+)